MSTLTHLTSDDLRAFGRCVGRIYEHGPAEAFPKRAVAALGEMIPGEMQTYDELDFSTGRKYGVGSSPDADKQLAALYPVFERFMDRHRLVERLHRTGDGTAYKTSDLLSRSQWHANPMYGECLRHIGAEDQLVTCLPTPSHLIIGLVCCRTLRTFTERDRTLMNLLRPHLVQAYDNAQAVSRVLTEAARVRGVLDLTDMAIVELDRDRRIRLCTPQAQLQLEAHFPTWKRRSTTLPLLLLNWLAGMTHCPRGTGAPLPRKPVVHHTEAGVLKVRLLGDSANEGWILLMQAEEVEPSTAPTLDPRVTALPKRLRRILNRLLEGDSEKEAAGHLKLSPHTVHQYVKMLYRELEVSSRAELMARCLRPAAD